MDLKIKDNSQLRLAPFTQLEYIESTGTQYIDTGVIQSGTNYLIEIEFSKTDTTTVVLMNDNNNITGGEGLMVVGQPSIGTIRFGNQYLNEWTINDYNKHYLKLEYTNGSVTLTKDNTSVNKGAAINPIVPYTIYVFANKRSGNIIGYNNLKLYSFHVKVDDNEVNLIPAKDRNDVVCLYDRVSGTFFYNQGTGNFVAGPEGNIDIPETILLKTTTLYHKNTPNVKGLQLLNSILDYQKTHQEEIKEYYYPTTQLWQDIIAEYPDIVQFNNMNHKLCVVICEAADPEQCAEDFLDAVDGIQQELEDYPDLITIIAEYPTLTTIIAEYPEVIHSLVDTGYETTLTSSGTQYIDTGFKPNQDTRVVLEFNDLNQSLAFLFGSRISGNNAEFGYLNGTTVGQGARYGTQERTLAITNNVKLNLDANKTNWTLSNGNTANFNSTTFQSTLNCLLFGHNNGGTANCVSIKVYYCKIYDNDTFIRWLVPIQNNGNPCMIDLLTGTKYTNQGTGSFTYSLEPKNA